MRTIAAGRALGCVALAGALAGAPGQSGYAANKPVVAASKVVAVPASLIDASNRMYLAYSSWQQGIDFYQWLLPYFYVNHRFKCVSKPKDPVDCNEEYQIDHLSVEMSNVYPATTQQLSPSGIPATLFSAALNNQKTGPSYGEYGDGFFASAMSSWTKPERWVFFCPVLAKPARACLASVIKSMGLSLKSWEKLYIVWKNDGIRIAEIEKAADPGGAFQPAVEFSKSMAQDLNTMSADLQVLQQAARPLTAGVAPEASVSCPVRTGPPKC